MNLSAQRDRLRDASLYVPALLALCATLLLVCAVVQVSVHGIDQRLAALSFGAFIAVGEFVRVTLPGDRESAPLGGAGAVAYAMTPLWLRVDSTATLWQVVVVTAMAIAVGVFPHLAVGRRVAIDTVARRLLTVAVAAALVRAPLISPLVHRRDHRWLVALVLVLVMAVVTLLDCALSAAVRSSKAHAPYLRSLRDELRASTGIGSAIGATGVLIALAMSTMGGWALPVFAVPLLLTQFSFRRYAAVRSTYLQTIRSLARVTEVGGYTETGHSRRVSHLSLAVGRDMGLPETELLDLEYAALMHDIGQLSLTDPIPGGATVVAARAEQRRIAALGAHIVRETGVLDAVADIIARQAEPYRQAHEIVDHSVPVSSRIIKAANAYDDLVGDALESGRRDDALERLRLGAAYEYDPRVVESLTRVVQRATRLGGL